MFNYKLKTENLQLRNRIQDLEERLCPCESHDYKEIHKELIITVADCEILRTYKCKRCGKVIKKYDWE
jgi:hypothetical protein